MTREPKTIGINELAKMRYAHAIRVLVGFSKKVLFLTFKTVNNALCVVYRVDGVNCAAFVSRAKFEICAKKAQIRDVVDSYVAHLNSVHYDNRIQMQLVDEDLTILIKTEIPGKYSYHKPTSHVWRIIPTEEGFLCQLKNVFAAGINMYRSRNATSEWTTGQQFTFLADAVAYVCK